MAATAMLDFGKCNQLELFAQNLATDASRHVEVTHDQNSKPAVYLRTVIKGMSGTLVR